MIGVKVQGASECKKLELGMNGSHGTSHRILQNTCNDLETL